MMEVFFCLPARSLALVPVSIRDSNFLSRYRLTSSRIASIWSSVKRMLGLTCWTNEESSAWWRALGEKRGREKKEQGERQSEKEQKNSSKMSVDFDAFLREKTLDSHPVESPVIILVEAAKDGSGGGLDGDGRGRQRSD